MRALLLLCSDASDCKKVFAFHEQRTLGDVGALLLEWSFEQLKAAERNFLGEMMREKARITLPICWRTNCCNKGRGCTFAS